MLACWNRMRRWPSLSSNFPGSFVRCHKSYLANMEHVVRPLPMGWSWTATRRSPSASASTAPSATPSGRSPHRRGRAQSPGFAPFSPRPFCRVGQPLLLHRCFPRGKRNPAPCPVTLIFRAAFPPCALTGAACYHDMLRKIDGIRVNGSGKAVLTWAFILLRMWRSRLRDPRAAASVVVIGGRNSRPTPHLAEICAAECPHFAPPHIESRPPGSIPRVRGCTSVGVTAGTPAPH